jgi:hypothetical protein
MKSHFTLTLLSAESINSSPGTSRNGSTIPPPAATT